jgi:cell division septation protein DedD
MINAPQQITRLALLLILLFPISLIAQSDDTEIKVALEKIDKGLSAEVRKELPNLVSRYPNNAAALYLQGRLATDGIEAVKFYQGVVDNFPKSEWADDALYRTYQYYYSLGLYRTADLKLQQLKKEYPNSQYITGKPEVTIPPVEEKMVNLPPKEIAPVESTDTMETVYDVDSAKTEENKISETNKSFTVQAGAYATNANADKQRRYFDDLGYKVEIVNKVRNGKNLFLVWVGSFGTMEEAREIVREIKSKYRIESMIVERY